jgi:hypothetical protein
VKRALGCLFLALGAVAIGAPLYAQGLTTASMTGMVYDESKAPIPGATVTAVHDPSGTQYETITNADGRFFLPAMRVGGPYKVTASLAGFQTQVQTDVTLTLGVAQDFSFTLKVATVAETITVSAQSDPILSSERTGAATSVSRETLAALPTVSQRLDSIVRLTPQYSGTMSFVGTDSRMNNITVDGAYFNNSFGLRNVPGDTSGVAPISLQAIEQVQVNIAPYDVRQGNFVGAGVNTVTRSGGNAFRGSVYRMFRNDDYVGTKAKGLTVNPGTFTFGNTGFWASGPVIKNKLFFFTNFEDESTTRPATTFRANAGTETVGGSVTRVLKTDLDTLSAYLKSNFDYDTGPYQDYDFLVPARRFIAKADYNISDQHKFGFRYNQLESSTDVLTSNSNSLGFGNRNVRTDAMTFQASNYQILENIKSGIGELNSIFGTKMANHLIIGYTTQDESRGYVGEFFPFVDILKDGLTYMSFGFEPFTPNNELRYNTFQVQDNFTRFGARHSQTFGFSFEKYNSENVFFQGAQSVYTYNSLAEFYTDANGFLANPNRGVSPVTLRRFQVGWNNIPGAEKPIQPLEVRYLGGYAQDEWIARTDLKVVAGVRFDVPFFSDTGYQNAVADGLSFRDAGGNTVQYKTADLPDANVLWSPRVGVNWDVKGDRSTQLRGGTGIFTGKPAYVWISNQIGNTGVLTGFEQLENTTARPWNPDTERYKPVNVTGAPAPSYALAVTQPGFKFPQIWRTDIGVDRQMPWGIIATGEFIYNQDVNGIDYINANLAAPNAPNFTGADPRPRWSTATNANRINSNVSSAVVLDNQGVGSSWNLSGSMTKSLRSGFLLKSAYSYGRARNKIDAGSIAAGSWQNNQHPGDPNNPPIAFSGFSPGHRVFIATAYNHNFFSWGTTTVSGYWEARTIGNTSYTFSGDLNGDAGTANDLIYIPRNTSEMNFQEFAQNNITYTAAQQASAWDAYINQDSYLSKHRGQYAERGAVFLPLVKRLDLSVAQDVFGDFGGARHAGQFRIDITNFGNMLNSDWGVGQRLVSNQPLIVPTAAQGGVVDSQGRAQYRMRVINDRLMATSLESTSLLADVYAFQLSFRYTFR